MDLFLITDEEKNTLRADILIEPIIFEIYDDILTKLYNTNYNRIIITKRYVETVGETKVYNALKALTIMSDIFATRIFLLNHRKDAVDKSIVKFSELGLRVLDIEVKTLSYEEFTGLEQIQPIDISEYENNTLIEDVQEIVREIKVVSSDDLREYVALNYPRILSTILKCEQALAQHSQLSEQCVALRNEVIQLKEAVNYYQDKYNYEKYENSELKHVNREAQQILQRYASSIKAYNAAILKSNINEEYIYHDTQRKTVVIYFKELEDIGFFKLFNILYDTLKQTYNLRVKGIVLENNVRRYFNPYVGYTILGQTPRTNEVVLNDLLVKYGNARKVLEVITRPQMQLEFLLVYDRTYSPNVCIQLPAQYTFFIGNKRENYTGMGVSIPDENFISPHEGNYTDISYLYRDTDSLTDISLKLYCNNNYFFTGLIQLCLDTVKHK